MYNVPLLHEYQGIDNLADYVLSFLFREIFLFSEFLVEVAILSILQDNVDVLFIIEIAEESDDVRVP